MRPADFAVEPFFGAGVTHDVHVGGAGPAVIVMHELGGLSPVALELGCQVVDRGYRVVMPRFFGRPGQDSDLKGFVQICIAHEFTLLRKNRTSKVTRWLRCLAQKYDDGKGVAAIGMCATGGLVLGLMLEDGVVAGVAASRHCRSRRPSGRP
jgi:dienelactone hydrolase